MEKPKCLCSGPVYPTAFGRRSFIQVGLLGGMGLSLPDLFRISARALDGVIEAIESEAEGWFALGVQWQPASGTASGLDIQLFRGLVDSCSRRQHKPGRAARCLAA